MAPGGKNGPRKLSVTPETVKKGGRKRQHNFSNNEKNRLRLTLSFKGFAAALLFFFCVFIFRRPYQHLASSVLRS